MSRKHNDDGDSHIIARVPMTTLFRWYMYDLKTKEPNKHVDVFDLMPVSEEGDEKERQESADRLDKIVELTPFLTMYAEMTATYVVEMQKRGLVEIPDLSRVSLETDTEKIKAFYRRLTFSALLTSYSSAVELGVIDAADAYTNIS